MKINDRPAVTEMRRPNVSGQRWTYKSELMDPREADLSQFGTEGWEFVGAFPVVGEDRYLFVFKRPA